MSNPKEEADAKGCGRDNGGRLSRSSDDPDNYRDYNEDGAKG